MTADFSGMRAARQHVPPSGHLLESLLQDWSASQFCNALSRLLYAVQSVKWAEDVAEINENSGKRKSKSEQHMLGSMCSSTAACTGAYTREHKSSAR
jgi:hypothetical protein